MLSSRTVLKIAAGILAAIIVIVVLYNVLSIPSPQNALPSRESAIPKDAVKMTPDMDIHPPVLHSDEWMDPVPLSSAINTAGGEDSPFIMPDGNTLYFFFTPDVSIPAEKQLTDGVTGIYVSRKINGVWSNAERVVLQDSGKLALDVASAEVSSPARCVPRFCGKHRFARWYGPGLRVLSNWVRRRS